MKQTKEVKYEIQEFVGRWKAIPYPLDEDVAREMYRDYPDEMYRQHKRNYPDTTFRLVEIETIRTVIDEDVQVIL